jgi:hypothetical protein
MGNYLSSLSLQPSFLSEESLSHAITMTSQGTSDLTAHISKFRGRKSGRLLKLPCLSNVELAVVSFLIGYILDKTKTLYVMVTF